MDNDNWNDNGEWGQLSRMNSNNKNTRLNDAKVREENVLKTLSKNNLGFQLNRYSVYNTDGKEVAQTIISKRGKKLRCPDIYATHPSAWEDVSLRIELKTHGTIISGNWVRTEQVVFDDYWELQCYEEIETRIIFLLSIAKGSIGKLWMYWINIKSQKRMILAML